MIFQLVVPSDLPFLWQEIRGHIQRALDREGSERYGVDDILRLALTNNVQVWIAADINKIFAGVVTEIVVYPRLRELRIWLVGGSEMKSWIKQAIETLEAFGRANQCTYICGGMREGWMRIGGKEYRKTGVTFEKRLME